ncbi:MAG: alanine racemase [Clostridiaceae bacterium]|nr:alanine racemase [Clostridiaceae bacterium]
MQYPCIVINLSKIKHNVKAIISLCNAKNIEVVGVTKVFCARKPIVNAYMEGGIKTIGDSRIENIKRLKEYHCKKILLRIPMESNVNDVIKYCDISLNSELDTIKKLSQVARRMNKVHNIILMVDVGDLREGILVEDVISNVKQIKNLDNIKLLGIGTNLTCYGGVIPDENNLGKLIKLKNEIERLFKLKLSIVSGGNSSSLYMVLNGTIPEGMNQLRIGEGIVLGRETAFGNSIPGCFDDAFLLKGEIIEIKNKPTVPTGIIGVDAFGETPEYEDKGIRKRAIIAIGRQDINVDGLSPLDKDISFFGGSSDHLLIDITDCNHDYKIGDIIDFTMDYGCLLKAMTSPYVKKNYVD